MLVGNCDFGTNYNRASSTDTNQKWNLPSSAFATVLRTLHQLNVEMEFLSKMRLLIIDYNIYRHIIRKADETV